MPANPKHLTTSKWQRFAKISAGILGGYLVTISVHLTFATWFNSANAIITMSFSGFILWVTLIIVAFIPKNGWKIWGIYLLITALFSTAIYIGKM